MFSINPNGAGNDSYSEYNLHSTMFSINPILFTSRLNPFGIYIPLCFLLIPHSGRLLHTDNCIYIPLCFLLISIHSSIRRQSVSIYIPLCFLLILILKWIFISMEKIYIPLCFLLILIQPREGPGNCKNLHSTMFSINPETIVYCVLEDVFTFHYVFY